MDRNTFLIRDYTSQLGYSEVTFINGLRNSPDGNFVPWATTSDLRRVIYARHGEHHGFSNRFGLRRYDTSVSLQRQKLCTSALGMIALSDVWTRAAVMKVSEGAAAFLLRRASNLQENFKQKVFDNIAHYFYTNGAMGYGRISTVNKESLQVNDVWNGILGALRSGSLEQKLAIHDAIGRKLLPANTSEGARYQSLSDDIREDWFDNKSQRGRVNTAAEKAKSVASTTLPGILSEMVHGIHPAQQSRIRAVDKFERDFARQRNANADTFYDELDMHNLAFGAGISGTTGTLLQAARAFGNFSHGELLKQYTLAIIAYLVGGGMHSYHEVLAIAKRAGISYLMPGSMDWLPLSFLISNECIIWRHSYYDIVELGVTHWRFNSGVVPSHLNQNLKV